MKAGVYPGLPHQPCVLTKARGITAPDIYNYLYSVGRLGVDCSGFVWYVLTSVARAGGLDLNRALARYLGASRPVDRGVVHRHVVLRSAQQEPGGREGRGAQPAAGRRARLPGRGRHDGHSAVIQSVDLAGGTIRYLQSTDVAEQNDRGVHESLITFDPRTPESACRTRPWSGTSAAPPHFPARRAWISGTTASATAPTPSTGAERW